MAKKMKTDHYLIGKDEVTVTQGSGNIFADLDLDDSEDLLARAQLALEIRGAIKAKKLTQKAAAGIMGIDQPKVSSIVNGHVEGFSTDRLIRFLNALGCDVKITVSAPKEETFGQVLFG